MGTFLIKPCAKKYQGKFPLQRLHSAPSGAPLVRDRVGHSEPELWLVAASVVSECMQKSGRDNRWIDRNEAVVLLGIPRFNKGHC